MFVCLRPAVLSLQKLLQSVCMCSCARQGFASLQLDGFWVPFLSAMSFFSAMSFGVDLTSAASGRHISSFHYAQCTLAPQPFRLRLHPKVVE